MGAQDSKLRGYLAVAIAATALLGGRIVRADDDAPPAPRTLAEHQFVPSALVRWGFIVDAAAMTSSAGLVGFDVNPPGSLVATRRASLIDVADTVSGNLAATPWLGFSVRGTSASQSGVDSFSAVAVGAHMSFGGDAGATVQVLRANDLFVAVRGDFGWNVTKDVLVPDQRLVTGHLTTLRPSLIAALSVTRAIGLQGSVDYAWQWISTDRTSGSIQLDTIEAAGALTLALHPVPVTLLVGAGVSRESSSTDLRTIDQRALLGNGGVQVSGETGIFYTGRRDLDLGAVMTGSFESTNNDRRFVSHLRFGYYF